MRKNRTTPSAGIKDTAASLGYGLFALLVVAVMPFVAVAGFFWELYEWTRERIRSHRHALIRVAGK